MLGFAALVASCQSPFHNHVKFLSHVLLFTAGQHCFFPRIVQVVGFVCLQTIEEVGLIERQAEVRASNWGRMVCEKPSISTPVPSEPLFGVMGEGGGGGAREL